MNEGHRPSNEHPSANLDERAATDLARVVRILRRLIDDERLINSSVDGSQRPLLTIDEQDSISISISILDRTAKDLYYRAKMVRTGKGLYGQARKIAEIAICDRLTKLSATWKHEDASLYELALISIAEDFRLIDAPHQRNKFLQAIDAISEVHSYKVADRKETVEDVVRGVAEEIVKRSHLPWIRVKLNST